MIIMPVNIAILLTRRESELSFVTPGEWISQIVPDDVNRVVPAYEPHCFRVTPDPRAAVLTALFRVPPLNRNPRS